MKKINEPLESITGPIKLFLDDINEIVESFQGISENGKLEIEIGGYKFDSIEDLSNLKQKEHRDIKISYNDSITFRDITFWTSENITYLICRDDRLVYRGAFAKIEKIIESHHRYWNWVVKSLKFFWPIALSQGLFIFMGSVYKNPMITNIGIGIFIVTIVELLLFTVTIPLRKSNIILVSKMDRPSFWTRNKDKLIIALISGIFTLIFGILGTLIVQSIMK